MKDLPGKPDFVFRRLRKMIKDFSIKCNPPSLIARFFHIPVGICFGVIAGAILAGLVSLLIR